MKGAFGGLVAIVLLGIYVFAVATGIHAVEACFNAGCTVVAKGVFSEGMAQAMATIGGIVSALVIAELAITTPGQQPSGRSLTDNPTGISRTITRIITAVFMLVWLGMGVWAFVVGVMLHLNMLEPLTTLGQAWFGLAVSAVYAYLGIKPAPQDP